MEKSRKFLGFIKTYLNHHITQEFGLFHYEIMGLLFKHHKLAIAAPRGFGKSHLISFFYVLFTACEGIKKKIMLVSKTGALAEYWTYLIRNELELNTKILKRYGNLKTDKWTQNLLRLSNGVEIRAAGSGYQIRGFRPDLIILDDAEDEEDVATMKGREDFSLWFDTTLINALDRAGSIVMIGTILHPRSFLNLLILEGKEGWTTRLYKAIDNGESLWPSRWPVEILESRRKEIGSARFEQEFQNSPLPEEVKIFKEEQIKYFDLIPPCKFYIAVDPAISQKENAHYTGIVVVGVDEEHWYVEKTINKRMRPSEIVETIFRLHEEYNPERIGIECVAYQKSLIYDIEAKRREWRKYPRVEELKSGGRRKEMRIKGLQPFFESGKILLRNTQRDLIKQLLMFPASKYDDLIDALAYIPELAKSPTAVKQANTAENTWKFEWDNRKRKKYVIWGNHRLR